MNKGHITTDDGCTIAYDYRERPSAPVIALSPSLGTAMGLFDAQVAALEGGYSVLRYAPRGHGGSSVPAGAYSLDRLGRDVIELFDALGIKRAHFAGVSLGGMTGQWLGFRAPERLLSLTLANTSAYMGPPVGWSQRIETVLAAGMDSVAAAVLERWFTPEFRTSDVVAIERIGAMLAATDPAGYAGCCAAIRDMDLRPTAALIKAPTLVIAGLRDPATPPDHAQWLADNICNAKRHDLDAAHLSNVELPEQFNQALLGFLEAL